ncbi:MAG: hypothetical protein ACRENB_17275 [Gemmatimonadales bacterium]
MTLARPLTVLALAGFASCGGGGLAPLPVPTGLVPDTESAAAAWADSTRPPDSRDIRFQFQFQDERASAGGRGRARLALPDSLRFDVRGPLGSGRASAFVAGDTAIWADPEEDVKKLVPNYPLFWAMLGIARPPEPGSDVRRFADGTVTAWQFVTGGDTLEYVRLAGPPARFLAEVRQNGRRIGRVETTMGPDGLPTRSRLTVPSGPARLDLNFYQNEKAAAFAPDTWARPAPPQR